MLVFAKHRVVPIRTLVRIDVGYSRDRVGLASSKTSFVRCKPSAVNFVWMQACKLSKIGVKTGSKDDFHLFIILLKLNPAAAGITLISSPVIPL